MVIEETVQLADSEKSRSSLVKLTPGPNAVDISPDKNEGILKEIIREGEGEDTPLAGDTVYVHYVGKFLSGEEFDSSRDRGDLFEFSLGKGNVIKAWDIGVATMKKGELCTLFCKPEFAYGENGTPPKIPPNSTLVFEVELYSWEGKDLSPKKDKGIIQRRIKDGEGYSTPNEGATVTIQYVGRYEGRIFDEREVTFQVGEGLESGIVDGIDRAIDKFKKGEVNRLALKPQYAFGEEGKEEFGIPGGATVDYEVTLVNFEKAKESWELDIPEKLEQANIFKTKGTSYFKSGNYKMAIKQYKKIIEYLENIPGIDEEKEKEQKQLLLSGYLNLAMCYLKIEEAVKAAHECDKALEIDPQSEKGLFRRGMARLSFNDLELAKKDFDAVLKIDSNNKAAANQIIVCTRKLKEQYDKERKLYSNMFIKYNKPESQNGGVNSDVLENPGTWGEDEHRKGQQTKPDSAGDGQMDTEDEKTKEQRFIESVNSENIEMLP